LASIDVYRGLVMFLMMAEVLRLCRVSAAVPDSPFWAFLCGHQSHAAWVGCTLHDLIQPSFSFLVGVSLPFSIASRQRRGDPFSRMLGHALWRALVLVLLGVFLRSIHADQTYWTFEDTLTQIGLGYTFLFLLGFCSMRTLWICTGMILAGYWLALALYPLPDPDFAYAAVGVSAEWLQEHGLNGFAAHWQKNSNLAWAFDTWFLNRFPRENPFAFNGGGYATLSFIPTLATMILGLAAGRWLRADLRADTLFLRLCAAGAAALAAGWLLDAAGLCPNVKRIWTPAWTLFSGGWCFLTLAGFHWLLDTRRYTRWARWLVVIGTNSIAAYLIAHLFDAFIAQTLTTHLGTGVFQILGKPYEPLLHGGAVLLTYWLILYWMYRRKLFLRI
jgi:predicted acyltransferase